MCRFKLKGREDLDENYVTPVIVLASPGWNIEL